MADLIDYLGSGETCLGCAEVIRAGDIAAAPSEHRPEQLLCVGCWWLRSCDLPLPGWDRPAQRRRNLSGVFRALRIPGRNPAGPEG